MLFENKQFSASEFDRGSWDEGIFQYCTFQGLEVEGPSFSGILVFSTMADAKLYWPSFNTAQLCKVTFEKCVFSGADVRSCNFVQCTFTDSSFALDNLNGQCIFDDCSFTECTFQNCTFEHRSDAKQAPVFTETTRFYNCSVSACAGFDGRL